MASELGTYVRHIAGGKSLVRAGFYATIERWRKEFRGLVLDLACGENPGYRRVLGLNENPEVELVGVEYLPAMKPSVVADLFAGLPFRSGVADAVICANFVNQHADPVELLREIGRVLKPGRVVLMTVPLVYPHNPEPTDYYRFTAAALPLLLERAGLTPVEIVPIGGRFAAATSLVEPLLRPRWLLAVPAALLTRLADAALVRLRPGWTRCPIAYVVLARAAG